MTRWLLPLLLLGCVDAPPEDTAPPATRTCEVMEWVDVDDPDLPVGDHSLSPDDLALDMMGLWRGVFTEANGLMQPAVLRILPTEELPQRAIWVEDDPQCGTAVRVPVQVYFDVPCLIYGDVFTDVVVTEVGAGELLEAKISAPRNLLDAPSEQDVLLTFGAFDDGVLSFDLLWVGLDGTETPGGHFDAAQQ